MVNQLQLNDRGVFGDLRYRPNLDGYVLRTAVDFLQFQIDAVIEKKGDILDEVKFQYALDQMPVIACLAGDESDELPFEAISITYEEYLRVVRKADN